jgi:hypothetical protein
MSLFFHMSHIDPVTPSGYQKRPSGYRERVDRVIRNTTRFLRQIGVSGTSNRAFRNDSAGLAHPIGFSGTIRVIGNTSGNQERRIGVLGTNFSGYREHRIGFSGTAVSNNPLIINKDSHVFLRLTL